MWTNQYGPTGPRLFLADVVLVISQTLERWAYRLDRLYMRIDMVPESRSSVYHEAQRRLEPDAAWPWPSPEDEKGTIT